jgi:hypothetical protein
MVQVLLFPTQTETDGLFVIVLSRSGITYMNQCGGTGCDQMEAEGFLVPVGCPDHLDTIKKWFRSEFGESCWCDGRLARPRRNAAASAGLIEALARVVAEIPCWFADKPVPLELDRERLAEGGEAWVPVRSAFGLGWLTWSNSD